MDAALLAAGQGDIVMRGILAAAFVVVASALEAQTGSVSGVVRSGGAHLANARAILDTTREVRTDATGRFRFADVTTGRHTLSVLALGMTPYSVNLIVASNDTLDFEVVLVKSVILDSVLIEGSTVREQFARAYADRKKMGIGKFMDSTEVKKFAEVRQALLFVPGIRVGIPATGTASVTRGGGPEEEQFVMFTSSVGTLCKPNVWIDGQNWGMDQGPMRTIRPDDVAGVEVYTRGLLIPDEFQPRGIERGCGALVIWTKRFWPQGKGKP
jgi:hypothetical protein